MDITEKNNLKFRTAKVDDAKVCFKIEEANYPQEEAASLENILHRIKLFSEGFVIADLNSEVIGFINSCATNKDDIDNENYKAMIGHNIEGENIIVMSVTITNQHQRKGYASLLMNEFINRMKAIKKEKIYLICKDDMIDFYKNFSFKLLGLSKSQHGGSTWYDMVRNLN